MKKNMSFKIIATVGLWVGDRPYSLQGSAALSGWGTCRSCQKEMGIPMTLHL